MNTDNQIEIYQAADGRTQIEVRLQGDTAWLSQAQMVELFGRNQSVVSRHIRNAIAEGEVTEKSNLQKMHIANASRPVAFSDRDVLLPGDYRIKSTGHTVQVPGYAAPVGASRTGLHCNPFSPCGRRWREAPDEGKCSAAARYRKEAI